MNIQKELSQNKIVLLLMPSTDYNHITLDCIKKLSKKSVCYITLNKTFDALKELFQKNKIKTDNITFIDAISASIKKTPEQTKGCYYISSPGALTELAIMIDKFLEHGHDYIIFDSITNLIVYETKAPVAKFLASTINKIRTSKTRALFYAISIKEQDSLIKESGMFADKVIELK